MLNHSAKIFGSAFTGSNQERLGDASAATMYSLKFRPPIGRTSLSIQLGWTGTITGTFTLQRTLLTNPDEATDADWASDAGFATSVVNPAGSAGTTFVEAIGSSGGWSRVKLVVSGGSGTVWGHVYAQN